MKIVVFGAGVQGTLYAVRLALAGHDVTIIARGARAEELRRLGAVIRNARSGRSESAHLPVYDTLPNGLRADLGLVCVRREQIAQALSTLATATGVQRFVWMVNHACGSELLYSSLGRDRTVLGFPGAAGLIQDGVDVYVDTPEQHTMIEFKSQDVAATLRAAGFRVTCVRNMDAWLQRHAVMITAICCAILTEGGSARRVAENKTLMRQLVLAIREGWQALDRAGVAPAPLPLRAIFQWVPLPVATHYWSRLLISDRGELYFAQHARRSVDEARTLIDDIEQLIPDLGQIPRLRGLYSVLALPSN
jgi:2-dehydropantoate 2-reductase